MRKTIRAADLFCGAGGTSTGLQKACDLLGFKLDLLAINHWNVAIATHSSNHPDARHMCESMDAVNPREVVPSGFLDLLWASPECTHFSSARGGKPISDQSRASAWHVLRWAEALHIDTILIENVREFTTWGPIGADGKPMKSRKGETFRAFLVALESLGYRVEWQILNAADYGAATTRRRLFIQARRGRKRIAWPSATHNKDGNGLTRWKPARDVIDWSVPGKSIFGRKKPLAGPTMARILAGLEKFGGEQLQPFLVVMRRHADARSLDKPLPSPTARGNHFALCEPFLTAFRGNHKGRSDGAGRNHSVQLPLPTLDTSNRYGLVEPFILPHRMFDGMQVDSVDSPLRTFTAKGGSDFGLVQPFLAKYYGSGDGVTPTSEPMPTVTTRDRFALVQPIVDGQALDIHFRMLTPRELASAMSFPEDYKFTGNREAVVKQIGNAVDGSMARALCEAVLA